MRLVELFLTETTEEDRALISLSSSLYDYIQKYRDLENASKYSSDYDEYDPELDTDTENISDEDKSVVVGQIGKIFDTPLEILNPVTIELQSSSGMTDRLEKEKSDDTDISPTGEVLGLWYGRNSTIVLNRDYLDSKILKSSITHELRHALDDYKSGFEANKAGGRYTNPKKKSHRKVKNDPYMGNLSYLAEPAEINARFLQVLHNLVDSISRMSKTHGADAERFIMRDFRDLLKKYRISDLFPEKEKSKDYKRLLKRGVDFIQKELQYRRSK